MDGKASLAERMYIIPCMCLEVSDPETEVMFGRDLALNSYVKCLGPCPFFFNWTWFCNDDNERQKRGSNRPIHCPNVLVTATVLHSASTAQLRFTNIALWLTYYLNVVVFQFHGREIENERFYRLRDDDKKNTDSFKKVDFWNNYN